MDVHRFDAFAKTIGRRGLLVAALASATHALLGRPDPALAAASCSPRQQAGQRCRRDSGCCSGRCQRKKNKRQGRCGCSALLKPCFDNFDCCARRAGNNEDVVCSDKNGFAGILCCVAFGGQCQSSSECCAEFGCVGDICTS